jgi:glycosyltransferase involved in cell wall biosynthesis
VSNDVILLPAYQAGPRLVSLVTELLTASPAALVVVVDDGSGPDSAPILETVAGLGCTVLRHGTNRGKGAALKTGFRHVAAVHPGRDVVAADADGQHGVTDILRVAERVAATGRLVLGVRRFSGDVPLASRFGNILTRLLFQAATGQPVQDTQTGLRAYPAALLDWLQSVPGEQFEYEMNVLLRAAREGHPIEQVDIATTYLDDNASSHFGALSDSVRIYAPLLRFMASSAPVASRSHR